MEIERELGGGGTLRRFCRIPLLTSSFALEEDASGWKKMSPDPPPQLACIFMKG